MTTNLLRIDASSRLENSYSRQLADAFINHWKQKTPDSIISSRNIIQSPIEHISDTTIQGFYTPEEAMDNTLKSATALSDQLIAELQNCDTLLISTPMYNFSIPSALKAWIDQIVRINKTFSYDGANFNGLLTKGKKAYIIAAYGGAGYTGNGDFTSANFLEPYLQFVLTFLGFEEVKFFSVEATTAEQEVVNKNMAQTIQTIQQTI